MQTGHLAHATLLMVDDNPKNLDLIGEIFKASGCRLLLCKSGERGLALAQQARPDLILLDVMMPGIDGYETCRQLKQNPETRDIPVLFLSALADAVNKVKGFEAGAVDFVSKPFDIAELLARVNTHLELKRAREELQAWNQALLRLQQEKDEFLDRVTHDLKNPLGNILLFSDHMA
ncbi:MAG: response regulator, partial [Candidatus Sericytochromatia bacterium]